MKLFSKILLGILAGIFFVFLAAYSFGFINMLIFFYNFITAVD